MAMLKSGEEGVTDLERVATAARQTGCDEEKEEGLVAVSTAASERLPFSKARCVALVGTIAAAPFLSVSKPCNLCWRRNGVQLTNGL
jgi:hypothetical protein